MSKQVPYPEWLKGTKGAGWRVEDSAVAGGAFIQPGKRRIAVPLGGKCVLCGEHHERAVRNHEQMHIRFTTDKLGRHPRTPKDIAHEYVDVCEDIRIDKLLAALGIKQSPVLCEAEAPKVIDTLKRMDDRGRILYAVATGKPDQKNVYGWMRKACEEQPGNIDADTIINIAEQASNLLDRGPTFTIKKQDPTAGVAGCDCAACTRKRRQQSFVTAPSLKATINVARWLQDLVGNVTGQPPQKQKPRPQDGDGSQGDEEETEDEATFDPEREKPAAEQEAEENEDNPPEPAKENPNPYTEVARWGPMTIEEVTLPRSLPGRLRSTWRPSDQGFVPGQMHRWPVDQKVFKRKRRTPGGTVLVDSSGSMGLSQEQVYEWMQAAPGAVVAAYSGDGIEGWLRIIAKRGRVCSEQDIHVPGGLNTVDGPALVWLGRQEPPRVWVSDGWVNGVGGTSEALHLEKRILLRKHRIIQVDPHVVGEENVGKWVTRKLREGR